MKKHGSFERLSILAPPVILCVFLGVFSPNLCAARAGQTGETAPPGSLDPATFRFNDRYTTPFGPAYADIWTAQQNFLACRPPVDQTFSYALCYFSGPAVATPIQTADGGPSTNPPLPCILSPDGTSASCTCYEIQTEQYPPVVPYFVNINGILNLDLYLRTIAACGHNGELCGSQAPVRDHMWWNAAPVCRAVNTNNVIPTAELISVFSTVKTSDYATGTTPNTTTCPAGKYAGCMTAPCYHTGKTDSAGNPLVECNCPVYDGPFELGQAGAPCDANELSPTSVGELDSATARQILIAAGVDPGAIENFIATFFPVSQQQAYANFTSQTSGMGYSSGQQSYGYQSRVSGPPGNSAAWPQLRALIDARYSSGPEAPAVHVWSQQTQQNSVGRLDSATARQILTAAGVDPGAIENFIATFFPAGQQQAYANFTSSAPGVGYSPNQQSYGGQSSVSDLPDDSATWAQLEALLDARYSSGPEAPPVYVWSAAHNPSQNHQPIDPPAEGCLPDVPGQKSCPLYSPMTQYPVAAGSPLCQKVCAAYRNDTRQDANGSPTSIQVGYSCDAALCTTLGNGQSSPTRGDPLAKANLLQNACGGLAGQNGLRAILALEQIDHCSCCASQVCGCANPGTDIDPDTQAEIAGLNAVQQQLGIMPQCQINGTLCGAQPPQ